MALNENSREMVKKQKIEKSEQKPKKVKKQKQKKVDKRFAFASFQFGLGS